MMNINACQISLNVTVIALGKADSRLEALMHPIASWRCLRYCVVLIELHSVPSMASVLAVVTDGSAIVGTFWLDTVKLTADLLDLLG